MIKAGFELINVENWRKKEMNGKWKQDLVKV